MYYTLWANTLRHVYTHISEKKKRETIIIINMHNLLLCYPILLQNAGFNFLNL